MNVLRSCAVALAAACLCVPGCATVRQSLGYALVPPQTERQLGDQIAAQVTRQQKASPNAALQAYVTEVGGRIAQASQSDRRDVSYTFTVLEDAGQVNAFAVPGGHLFVYTGLVALAANEAELAGVLAHEVAHVAARHSADQLATQYGLQILEQLALGEQPNEVARIATQLGEAGAMAHFSRDAERQADRRGVKYAVTAGYDAGGLATFFERMKKTQGSVKRDALERFLATHPATQERIDYLQALAQRNDANRGRLYRDRYLQATAALRR